VDADDSNGETEEEGMESSGGSDEEGDGEEATSGSENEEGGVPIPGRFFFPFYFFHNFIRV